MSLIKVKIAKKKISNIKARRDVKRKRSLNMRHFNLKHPNRSKEFQKLLSNIDIPNENKKEYIQIHQDLINHNLKAIKLRDLETSGSPERLYDFSLALIQVYLHRITSLYEGSFQSLVNNNTYLMALSIRGLFETTAAIGFLYSRVNAYKEGNISADELDNILMKLLLGTRDKGILEDNPSELYQANNVMKMLDYADKIFYSKIMKNDSVECRMLRVSYERLCEFCHPNFHSGSLAYKLDKENQQLTFSHTKHKLAKQEVNLIGYVFIGISFFIQMCDQIEEIVSSF
ncbi:hypothetical protein A6E13_18445 [Aliivibrio fischeri]|uniref:hypothetical protein n=1 Tax=Aliivibrio fischeri TaxID=668 RepID=UPI00080EAEDE|nr:hypothetical protein [Aliivibrio fischeri]OCH31082.1 hypothetical protein A6E13_18445 [Aliivibrio fischeri]